MNTKRLELTRAALWLNDIRAIAQVCGMSSRGRPDRPHEFIHAELIPRIRALGKIASAAALIMDECDPDWQTGTSLPPSTRSLKRLSTALRDFDRLVRRSVSAACAPCSGTGRDTYEPVECGYCHGTGVTTEVTR